MLPPGPPPGGPRADPQGQVDAATAIQVVQGGHPCRDEAAPHLHEELPPEPPCVGHAPSEASGPVTSLDPIEQPGSARVPAPAWRGRQEGRQDPVGLQGRQVTRAEDQDVGVVVLASVARHGLVPAVGRTHPGHLVGRHGGADPHRVDDHAQVRAALGDRESDLVGTLRPVAGALVLGPEVVADVAELPEGLRRGPLRLNPPWSLATATRAVPSTGRRPPLGPRHALDEADATTVRLVLRSVRDPRARCDRERASVGHVAQAGLGHQGRLDARAGPESFPWRDARPRARSHWPAEPSLDPGPSRPSARPARPRRGGRWNRSRSSWSARWGEDDAHRLSAGEPLRDALTDRPEVVSPGSARLNGRIGPGIWILGLEAAVHAVAALEQGSPSGSRLRSRTPERAMGKGSPAPDMRTLLSQFCESFEEVVRPLLDPLQQSAEALLQADAQLPGRRSGQTSSTCGTSSRPWSTRSASNRPTCSCSAPSRAASRRS